MVYQHLVQYYETDRMGITHHSNYVRWMEEARTAFLDKLGWPYDQLEAEGLISPVVSINCHYKASTTFADQILIDVWVIGLKAVKLILGYRMTKADGTEVCLAESEHSFLDQNGQIIHLKKQLPDFYQALLGAGDDLRSR